MNRKTAAKKISDIKMEISVLEERRDKTITMIEQKKRRLDLTKNQLPAAASQNQSAIGKIFSFIKGGPVRQIEDSIKHAKDYLTLKLRLYQLMDHILKNKQFCIAYTRDIANTSVKIYNKTLHEKINKKELSPKTIDNLTAVANKIISLIKLNIDYINTLQSIVKKMNDTLTLEELETLEQKTYKLLENDEIKCCQLADMLQLLALECNDQGCTNIFTSEAASVPEFDKIELKTPNKEFCSSFNKNYFTQLGKYFGQ